MGMSEASSAGLTGCLHRQLSTMSSEGESQGRPVLRRRLGPAEKAVQAAEAKANGMLIEEEKVEMGKVSRVDKEGWREWAGPSSPGAHGSSLSLTTTAMQVKLSVFWDYAKALGLCTTLAICLLYAGQSAFAIGANIWLSAWTNEAMVDGRQNNTSQRLGVYATLGIVQGEPTGIPGRGSSSPFLTPELLNPQTMSFPPPSQPSPRPMPPSPTLAVHLPLSLPSPWVPIPCLGTCRLTQVSERPSASSNRAPGGAVVHHDGSGLCPGRALASPGSAA